MKKIEKINKKIYEIRQSLQDLIKEKSNLLDPQVILESQKLDDILNEYNKLIGQSGQAKTKN